jgi:hypothetical protein
MRHCTLEIAEADQAQLRDVIHHGSAKARIQTRARILLRTAEGWHIDQIADALDVSVATITNTRTRWGLEQEFTTRCKHTDGGPYMPSRKRSWWRWPAAQSPRITTIGRFGCCGTN